MSLRGRIKTWPWWLQANYLAVVVFMVFSTALNGLGRMTQAGALLILVAGYRFFSYRVPRRNLPAIPRSVKYYLAWVAWCIITGPWVAIYRPYLMQQLWVLVQVVVCMGACYVLFSRQRQDSYMPYILLIIVAFNIVAINMGYALVKEEGMRGIVETQVEVGEQRIAGLSGNANSLGFVFLNGIWALMLLWKGGGFRARWLRNLYKPLVVVGICLCGYYAFQTGSRKTFMTVAVLCVGWAMWAVPGRWSVGTVFLRIFMAILLAVVGVGVFGYVMQDTVVGQRLWELFDSGGGNIVAGAQEDVRYLLLQEGLEMFFEHPLLGVGFMQYIIHSSVGLFAHSDYVEVLADTGLIGFILYQSYAVSMVIMLWKLLRRRLSPDQAYKVRMYLLFIFCNHYMLCFGATFAGAHWHMVIMTFIALEAQKLWDEHVRGKCLCGT